jgi:hypothetical protein
MVTEQNIALSQNVADRAAGLAHSVPSDFDDGLDVGVKLDSHVLKISYTAATAQSAWVGASVFSRAYIDYRNEVAADAAHRSDVPPMTELITPASPPSHPATVQLPLILGLSALVGVALGFLVALVIDRLTGRIRSEEQVAQLAGLPVLGIVSAAVPLPEQDAANGTGAEVFGHLAARFVQGLDGRESGALLVTAPTGRESSSAVALNTACALARAGRETVVIRLNVPGGAADFANERDVVVTDGPEDESTPPLFDVTEIAPVEKAPVRQGWVRTPLPNLFVHFVKINGSADESVVADLKASIARIVRDERLVVVEGQPVLGGSLTPIVALACDATVLAIDLSRDRRDHVAMASAALRHVANVVGCLVVRPGHRRPAPGKTASTAMAPARGAR